MPGSAATASAPPESFIGRYTLEAPLGQGAIGKLYRGVDKYTSNPIVLQFIDAKVVEGRQAFKVLQDYVRRVSWLWSVYVARVYSVRQLQLFSFLLEEYAGPTNLSTLVSTGGPLETRTSLMRAIDIAQGLYEAHRHGFTHQHLKPSGIILSEQGRCRLTGFGVSLFYDPASELVLDGGTRNGPTGRTADLQALGNILAFMLTGQEGSEGLPAEDFEGKAEVGPFLERLIDPTCAQTFPDTAQIIGELTTLLEAFGGQPNVYAFDEEAGLAATIPGETTPTSLPSPDETTSPTDALGPPLTGPDIDASGPATARPRPTEARLSLGSTQPQRPAFRPEPTPLPDLPPDDLPPPSLPPLDFGHQPAGLHPTDSSPAPSAPGSDGPAPDDLMAAIRARAEEVTTQEAIEAAEIPRRRLRIFFVLLLSTAIITVGLGLSYHFGPPSVRTTVNHVLRKLLRRPKRRKRKDRPRPTTPKKSKARDRKAPSTQNKSVPTAPSKPAPTTVRKAAPIKPSKKEGGK